jgi:hypothetical protein
LIAKRGKKVATVPQVKKEKELMTDGGRAFRLRMGSSFLEGFTKGVMGLLPNRLVMTSEHNDKPEQTKKRKVKLKWLIRNIPKGGAKAPEMVEARVK